MAHLLLINLNARPVEPTDATTCMGALRFNQDTFHIRLTALERRVAALETGTAAPARPWWRRLMGGAR